MFGVEVKKLCGVFIHPTLTRSGMGRLTIPPYSVLVFRQDLAHAGTAYNSQNLRLHFFMDLNVDDYSDDSGSIKWMDKDFL